MTSASKPSAAVNQEPSTWYTLLLPSLNPTATEAQTAAPWLPLRLLLRCRMLCTGLPPRSSPELQLVPITELELVMQSTSMQQGSGVGVMLTPACERAAVLLWCWGCSTTHAVGWLSPLARLNATRHPDVVMLPLLLLLLLLSPYRARKVHDCGSHLQCTQQGPTAKPFFAVLHT